MSTPTDGYILYDSEGNKIGYGTGAPHLRDGQTFETSADVENDSRTDILRADDARRDLEYHVEGMKSQQEYDGKSENANRWLSKNPAIIGPFPLIARLVATLLQINTNDIGDYSIESYPWLSIEIDEAGKTPREAAEMIMAAVKKSEGDNLGPWEVAKRRVALREALRS